jgi:hypothetical protein
VDEAGQEGGGEGGLNPFIVQAGEQAAGARLGNRDDEKVQEGHFVMEEVGVELEFARVFQGEEVVQEPC